MRIRKFHRIIRRFAFYLLHMTDQGHTAPVRLVLIGDKSGITTIGVRNKGQWVAGDQSTYADYFLDVDTGDFADWLLSHSA